MKMLKKFGVSWVVAMAALLALGCSETHEHGCGAGTALSYGGASFCVYEASIIEEGFSCPAHVPSEYDFDGFRACGVPAETPAGLEEEVYRVFRPDSGGGDAGGCEYMGRTYSSGDSFCADDGCNTCSCFAGTVACGGILCTYPEAGLDAGATNCTPFEIFEDPGPVDASVVDASPRDYQDFHLSPVPIDPVSLRLYNDGTFEWMQDGCDFRSGSSGRWAPGAIILDFMPGAGQATFDWIDPRTDGVVQLEFLRGRQQTTDIEIDFGGTAQVWKPGGKCAICGDLGPTGSTDCEPLFGP